MCTALFIVLDAAPVLPSTASFEPAGWQPSNDMAKTILNMFSKSLTTAGDEGDRYGSIQVDSKEVALSFLDFMGSLISAEREKTDPNDKTLQIFFDIFDTAYSLLSDRYNGNTRSDDEIIQTILNSFGAYFSAMFEDSEVHVQSHSYNEKAQKFFNLMERIFPDIEKRICDNDELTKTGFYAMKTLFSLFRPYFEEGGEIQSSDDQMKLFCSLLSERKERSQSAEAQSLTELERTIVNIIVQGMIPALRRYFGPDNQAAQTYIDTAKEFISLLGKKLANEHDIQLTDKIDKMFMEIYSTSLSVFKKMIENDEFLPVNEVILNLFGKMLSVASKDIDPNDDAAQKIFNGLREILSALRSKSNGGWGGQIQSDNELPWAFFDLFGSSALLTKASPKDEVGQTFLSLFNTLVSGAKSKVVGGGAQEVHADTLTTYTAKHFDQSINAAVAEGDTDLTDETKAQLQGAILSGLASDFY